MSLREVRKILCFMSGKEFFFLIFTLENICLKVVRMILWIKGCQGNITDFEKSDIYFGFFGVRKILWVLWNEEYVMDFVKSGKYFGLCGARKTLWVL